MATSVWAGPEAKKMKKGDFHPIMKAMTKEELKINRQQRKKELKKNRQQTERKDMFDIICQAKQVWGNLRRYTLSLSQTHTKSQKPFKKSTFDTFLLFPSFFTPT